MKLAVTSKCQRQGNMLLERLLLFKMEILILRFFLLLIVLLYIIPLPSNQVPQLQQQQLLQLQQLRSSAHHSQPITPLPLSSSAANNQQQHPDAPKLIPLSALERYQESAELKLFCSASAPQSGGRLHFEWRKNNGEQLSGSSNEQQLTKGRYLHVSILDDSSSVLRISHLEAEDSGNYTCLARNQHGFDSSTVRINVNVRLKWIREPPGELQVRAGKSVQLECDASGQPAPLISWTSLKDHQTINSKILRIDRAQVNDSGLYECRAGYLQQRFDHHQQTSEHLRKVVKLLVNVPRPFNDQILPVGQRNGEYVENLGHIVKLDTLFSAKLDSSASVKFSIHTRHRSAEDIAFNANLLCSPDKCDGPYQYNLEKLKESGFNATKRTIVMISGFLSMDRVEWMERTKSLWLQLEDVNVILVTWRNMNRYIYSRAVASTPIVARQITILLYYLAELNDEHLTDDDFAKRIHFVGHSLGAHIAGFVGQDLGGKMGRITGLDPAGPSFDLMTREFRLDRSDALLVDVFHTNSGKMHYMNLAASAVIQSVDNLMNKVPVLDLVANNVLMAKNYTGEGDTAWYGIDTQVGDIDYYANSGRVQPGCSGLLHICDHGRSHEIYEDVLNYEVLAMRLALNQPLTNGWFKRRGRLLAFNSIDYESFLTGNNFNVQCPSLLGGRERPTEETDETFKYCSLPIDLLTPVDELMSELKSEYNVNFNDKNYQSARQYYFKTHSNRPLVGDHYLLKIRLDPLSSWDVSCALKAEMRMASGANYTTEVNKEMQLVRNERFFGIAMPFVRPMGGEGRRAIDELLNAPITNQTGMTGQIMDLVKRIIPMEVNLSLKQAGPSSIVEAAKKKLARFFTLGFGAKLSSKCNLGITSVEVGPIVGLKRNFIGLYGSSLDSAGYPRFVSPDEHVNLVRYGQRGWSRLSANALPSQNRRLDGLFIG